MGCREAAQGEGPMGGAEKTGFTSVTKNTQAARSPHTGA